MHRAPPQHQLQRPSSVREICCPHPIVAHARRRHPCTKDSCCPWRRCRRLDGWRPALPRREGARSRTARAVARSADTARRSPVERPPSRERGVTRGTYLYVTDIPYRTGRCVQGLRFGDNYGAHDTSRSRRPSGRHSSMRVQDTRHHGSQHLQLSTDVTDSRSAHRLLDLGAAYARGTKSDPPKERDGGADAVAAKRALHLVQDARRPLLLFGRS